MKKNAYKILCLSLLLLVGYSCTEDMKYKPGGVNSVSELYSPSSNYYAELVSGSGKYIDFSWASASAEDGASPMYEVVFYKDAASTTEVARVSAGVSNHVSIAHKDLNKIMNKNGVDPEATGEIYWSVIASRATTEAPSHPAAKKMTVKRLKGFRVSPDVLYLTGSATENGVNIENAIKFRDLGDAEVFEIFTKLTPGDYSIADGNKEDSRKFGITDGIIMESDPTPISNAKEAIYRINVDLSTSSVTVDEVTEMRFMVCSPNIAHALAYKGGGVWSADGIVFEGAKPWGDDRYFFRANIGGVDTKFASKNKDNGGPSNAASVTGDIYSYVDGNQWDYSFKVIPFYRDKSDLKVNVQIYLNATGPMYSHKIEFPDLAL